MNKRNTQQRRRAILDLLNQQGEVSVDELALRFETSEVTIRKDLTALEDNGLLLRKYGGAVPLPQELMAETAGKISARKQALAKAADAARGGFATRIENGRNDDDQQKLNQHAAQAAGLAERPFGSHCDIGRSPADQAVRAAIGQLTPAARQFLANQG